MSIHGNIRGLAAVGAIGALTLAIGSVAMAEDSTICQDALQGKIARDRKGNTGWDEASLDRLCAGSASVEPARCFDRVMHGGVNWGHGTNWTTAMAISLCRGSADAAATVACFETQLLNNVELREAFDACAHPAPARPRVATAAPTPRTATPDRPTPPKAAPIASATPASGPEGPLAGDCGAEREVLCAYLASPCATSCMRDPGARPCKDCIAGIHTLGIDCWSCLYGGSASAGSPAGSPYFACRDFVCSDPIGGANPRARGTATSIGEECGPCQPAASAAGRPSRRCCLRFR